MENLEHVSFVVVVIGEERVEATQYWELEASLTGDRIADAIVAFSNKHGVAIRQVIIRPINN